MFNFVDRRGLVRVQAEQVRHDVYGDGAEDDAPAGGADRDNSSSQCQSEDVTIAHGRDRDHTEVERREERAHCCVVRIGQEILRLEQQQHGSDDEDREAEDYGDGHGGGLVIVDFDQEPVGWVELMLVNDGFGEGVAVPVIIEHHLDWEKDPENHDGTQVVREECNVISVHLTTMYRLLRFEFHIVAGDRTDDQYQNLQDEKFVNCGRGFARGQDCISLLENFIPSSLVIEGHHETDDTGDVQQEDDGVIGVGISFLIDFFKVFFFTCVLFTTVIRERLNANHEVKKANGESEHCEHHREVLVFLPLVVKSLLLNLI